MRLPTVIIRDVLRVNSDEDIVRSLRTQNRHLSEGLDWDKVRPVYATGDGRAMTLSATRCSSPRWCSVRAVSDTDTGALLQRSVREVRALRGAHWRNMPGPKGWRAPKCVNCTKAGCEDTAHGAFSWSAGSEQNGMIWLGRRWRTASSRRPGCRRPHTYGRGIVDRRMH
ncbi:hypothetical protein EVAR_84204_1 [Eumeta japonica]|uniref:Uncharacterized protein n=1 Tax=Eumeta variegata TaxID=151549 RepID=A0A4C1SA83_EUMVA|nr:hypothetical protein EVAR_84204_1 [Eumeta japonica]